MTLPVLIAAIERGDKPDRELSDRVLLACTKWHWTSAAQVPGGRAWWDPENKYMGMKHPDCLGNLEDAKLAVPEGWIWKAGSDISGTFYAVVEEVGKLHMRDATGQSNAATALCLAGLKARLAQQEQER